MRSKEDAMDKEKIISQIYKILLLYEDVIDKKIALQDYLSYLDRMYVYWVGADRKDIYNVIKGLRVLEENVEHQTVKSMVFHLIHIV